MINYLKNLDPEAIVAVIVMIGMFAMFVMFTMSYVMKNAILLLIGLAAPIASVFVSMVIMLICGIVCVVCENKE